MTQRRGCYPGSFNPLHVTHLAIAEAAVAQCDLARIDLVLSRVALGKEDVGRPAPDDRLGVAAAAASTRPWLGAVLTDRQLLADLAEGYDVLVLGADKWSELLDPAFYGGSRAARDAALARLPPLAVAPRAGLAVPTGATVLRLDPALSQVSATAIRRGARSWMAREATTFDHSTGAWSEPERYDRWRGSGR